MHVDADATMVVKTRSELWQIIQNSETVTNLVIGMMHMHTNSNESLIMFRYEMTMTATDTSVTSKRLIRSVAA